MLPRDQDTLRIPAFLRKRNLNIRQRKPLVLTALDRKNRAEEKARKRRAGKKRVSANSVKRMRPKKILVEKIPQKVFNFEPEPAPMRPVRSESVISHIRKVRHARIRRAPTRKIRAPVFQAPMLEAEIFAPPPLMLEPESIAPVRKVRPAQTAKTKPKKIGSITHYFPKISVAVIQLAGSLSVGDCITYQTEDDLPYEQIVESMEIDRQPVFAAKKGDDIGIKILKAPHIGSSVSIA